jgi:8-oxo-dGTP pyrophosphatase MutT (NUDIX family)
MSDRWMAPSSMLARLARRMETALAAPAQTYLPLVVAARTVGWVTPERSRRLAAWPAVFKVSPQRIDCTLGDAAALTETFAEIARALAAENALSAWRDERYAVAEHPGDAPLFKLERAAARYFGIQTFAAHANGVVADRDGWRMWLARRSPTKAIDPGLLDNLVGGGMPAGASVQATLVRESWEEAGISEEMLHGLRLSGTVTICRDQPDGLQRETIYVHDLWLPPAFMPANQDDEVVEHRLCTPDEVLAVAATDAMTADASLVTVDFLLRQGHVGAGDPSRAALEALRHADISSPRRG